MLLVNEVWSISDLLVGSFTFAALLLVSTSPWAPIGHEDANESLTCPPPKTLQQREDARLWPTESNLPGGKHCRFASSRDRKAMNRVKNHLTPNGGGKYSSLDS